MKKILLAGLGSCLLMAAPVSAASLKISIGIREVTGTGPAFSNGGSTGGIEWVALDGQTLVADGSWQTFTFTPTADTLAAFAGASANGTLDTDWAVFENLRILNFEGITSPIILRIDDITNTTSTGSVVHGFEAATVGTESFFQEPGFSGSTSANLVATPASSSLVTSADAFSGTNSDELKFQFLDATTTRWVRVTTSGTGNVPNPAVRVRETGFAPTITFRLSAVVVPEPGAGLLSLATAGLLLSVRRRKL